MKHSYNDTNKTNKIEIKKAKKSPSKHNHKATKIRSPAREKLQKKKKDSFSSSEDLSTNDKNSNNTSQKNLKDLSTSKKDGDTKEQLRDKKKAKTVDLFEERIEKKKNRASMYEKYLQRGGARNPGSKEIPSVRKFIFSKKDCPKKRLF